jgi:DNA polymerase-3 subunit alpha
MDHPAGEPSAAFADALVGALGEKNVFVALDSPSARSVSLAESKGLPVVAACEARCITRDDTQLLSLLECIRDGTRFDDTAATRQVQPSLHLRTPGEMARLFSGLPEALAHTQTIADRCSVDPRRPPQIPPVRIPPSLKSQEEYLEQLAYAGLAKKYPGCAQSVRERLTYELRVIRDNGFEGLYLLQAHLAATAADMGIMTAVRGAGSASLTAYLLGITDVDPLRHGLYFERFLNPERVTIPNFVLDVGHKDRDRLMKHLTELYGPDSVCGICASTRLRGTRAAREVKE